MLLYCKGQTHCPEGGSRSAIDANSCWVGEAGVCCELGGPGVRDAGPRGGEVPVDIKQLLGIHC